VCVRATGKGFVYGAIGLALGAALYLVVVRDRRESPVVGSPGKPAGSRAALHAERPPDLPASGVRAPGEPESGSGAASPSKSAGPLPETLEEALKDNAALAKDLACRDEQAKFDMDYQLRMVASIGDCLAGRIKTTGTISFLLHFDNDPATRRAVGTVMELGASQLLPEDDAIVLECVRAYHTGSVLQSSAKYGAGGGKRHMSSNINLPLEDSYIFRMVREGSFTAGTGLGCEVP
jgi:hypothetical protein